MCLFTKKCVLNIYISQKIKIFCGFFISCISYNSEISKCSVLYILKFSHNYRNRIEIVEKFDKPQCRQSHNLHAIPIFRLLSLKMFIPYLITFMHHSPTFRHYYVNISKLLPECFTYFCSNNFIHYSHKMYFFGNCTFESLDIMDAWFQLGIGLMIIDILMIMIYFNCSYFSLIKRFDIAKVLNLELKLKL